MKVREIAVTVKRWAIFYRLDRERSKWRSKRPTIAPTNHDREIDLPVEKNEEKLPSRGAIARL